MDCLDCFRCCLDHLKAGEWEAQVAYPYGSDCGEAWCNVGDNLHFCVAASQGPDADRS